jgi:LysM repeat protein
MPITYTVRSGDTLGKIAGKHGFKDYREIYDHPANAIFKAKRPNPGLIYPGDVIVIPDKGARLPSATSTASGGTSPTGATRSQGLATIFYVLDLAARSAGDALPIVQSAFY